MTRRGHNGGRGRWVRRCDSADEVGEWRQRYDAPGQILATPHTTADGVMLAEGFVAKPGILRYVDAEGNVTRELVPATELHNVDSLGTLGRVPVTLEHPDVDVSPDNVAGLGVGDVDSVIDASGAGGFVRIRLAIRRADAIAAIEGGKVELSPGYRVRVDPTPGVDPVFGSFDAVQRGRVYNHVALVDSARGGSQIRLRADGAAYQIPDEQREVSTVIINPNLLALLALLGADPSTFKTDDAGLAEVKRRVDSMRATNDGGHTRAEAEKMNTDMQTLRDEVATLTGKLATITGVADALKARADSDTAEAQKKVDKAEGEILLALAKRLKINGVEITDKATALADLRRTVAAKHLDGLGVTLADDADDGYIRGIIATIPVEVKVDSADAWAGLGGDAAEAAAAAAAAKAKADAAVPETDPTKLYFTRADAAFRRGQVGGTA